MYLILEFDIYTPNVLIVMIKLAISCMCIKFIINNKYIIYICLFIFVS